MAEYLIVSCPKCGEYSAVREGSKTHTCPYCGYRMRIEEAGIIAKARSGREAREVILRLKTPNELKRRIFNV